MNHQPLAYRMRPRTLDEVIGQEHLVSPGKIINRMVVAKQLSSMILYGPPGTGKTSIASAIAGSTKVAFRQLNAATDTKKDLQIVAEEAKMSGSVILLLDEIHRLDKTKQDFLLPHLENGRIILVGATTENPYISINPAIRSRTQIFELKPLSTNDIKKALINAIEDTERGLGKLNLNVSEEAFNHFANSTNGDVRSALNALELAAKSTEKSEDEQIHISISIAEECIQKKALSYDKDGDNHYDVLSALQKSIRGSDVNASLHYAARLMEAGDLTSLMRRLLVIAYEDIGLGNPQGAARTVSAIQAAERLGLPEARIPLANAIIELALSPKSNTVIRSIDSALSDIRNGHVISIPDHLKDAHYSGAHKLGREIHYKYPHDYPGHYVHQQYLPDSLKNAEYFKGEATSAYEEALIKQYQKYHQK